MRRITSPGAQPNIACWVHGGCMICGTADRDDNHYSHDLCLRETAPDHWRRMAERCAAHELNVVLRTVQR